MTDTEAEETPDQPDGPEQPDVPRRWTERIRGMDPENRRRVIESLALRTPSGWTHFVVMMALSVGIAVMGLSANSAAVVIGAMLLAPLMTPVLGTAASLTMALSRSLWRSVSVLMLASFGSVVLSWLLSIPVRDGPLSAEVIARTSPDARDLVVALAAGAAGAYATARADLSNSLPGVAIAVALVPPLGAAGMALEAGRADLARGALLLYSTNLAAIVVAGVLVFVLTGFAPPRRLAEKSTRVIVGTSVVAVILVAVAVPLMIASVRAADRARERQEVERAVTAWLAGSSDEVDEIRITGTSLDLRVFGLEEPPPSAELEARIRGILGEDAEVTVSWTQAVLVRAEETGPSDDELLETEVRAVVEQWLDASGISYEITQMRIHEGVVRVSITSAERPPGVDDLAERLVSSLGTRFELEVDWTPRTVLRPGDGSKSLAEIGARLERIAADWAVEQADLRVVDVVFDGATVTIDLVGTVKPDGTELESMVRQGAGLDDLEVRVWFSERQAVVPAPTPTATPEPTPTPSPTPTPEPVVEPSPAPTTGTGEEPPPPGPALPSTPSATSTPES
jgi:uncharacterized hydrophobic protein (TIGR00271 family)